MSRTSVWTGLTIAACVALVTTVADAAPKKKKKGSSEAPRTEEVIASDFDRQAAATAINEVSLNKCKATNAAKGEGHVTITFAPGGGAQVVKVDKGPWIGTPVAKCMIKEFKKAKVPAFKGEAVTVGKSFHFE